MPLCQTQLLLLLCFISLSVGFYYRRINEGESEIGDLKLSWTAFSGFRLNHHWKERKRKHLFYSHIGQPDPPTRVTTEHCMEYYGLVLVAYLIGTDIGSFPLHFTTDTYGALGCKVSWTGPRAFQTRICRIETHTMWGSLLMPSGLSTTLKNGLPGLLHKKMSTAGTVLE